MAEYTEQERRKAAEMLLEKPVPVGIYPGFHKPDLDDLLANQDSASLVTPRHVIDLRCALNRAQQEIAEARYLLLPTTRRTAEWTIERAAWLKRNKEQA